MKFLGYTLTTKKIASPTFLPDFTATSIDDIDFHKLESLGIEHLLFDLDQTLRRPYSRKLPSDVITLLNEVNHSKQFKSLNLVSNNQRNLRRYGEPIGARIFQPFRKGLRLIRKPNPLFFEHVLRELDTTAEKTVMIGDRLHADVYGGNHMGMFTLYVKKRGPIDYWFDWILLTRLRERRRLRDAVASHKEKQRQRRK